jgi:hypothetical protein
MRAMVCECCARVRMLVALLLVVLAPGCGLMIGESFDDYQLIDGGVPDTGPPDGAISDGEIPDSGPDTGPPDGDAPDGAIPDSGPDTGSPDGDVPDGAISDSGIDVTQMAVIRLGQPCEESGNATSFEFDTGVEDWKLHENEEQPMVQSVEHEKALGSPRPGSLRLHSRFNVKYQSSRVELELMRPAAIRCISARIFVPRGSLSYDLENHRAAWLMYALSGACFAQAGPKNGNNGTYWREIAQDDVWYEVAWSTNAFSPLKECQLRRDAIDVVGIGVSPGDDVTESSPLESSVFIDNVKLWH